MFNVDMINRISISGAKESCFCFRPLWLIATNSENPDTLNCRNHNHAFYELHIILSGKLEYSFGDKTLVLGENEFTVIPPHNRHKVNSHTKNIEKFTLAFEVLQGSDAEGVMKELSGRCLILGNEGMLQFRRILQLCNTKKIYKAEQIYLSLCNLLFEISEASQYSKTAQLNKQETDDRVFKAKKYIEDNFDVFFSCAEVASYCRLSEKQLGRLFMSHENISLLGYIHEKKLEAIKKALVDKEMSHREISETLGFSSPQYYGKFILRMTGMTPEEFRKSVIKN